MRVRRPDIDHLLLVGIASIAVAAFAYSLGSLLGWVLLVPILASARLESDRVPEKAAGFIKRGTWAVVGLVGVFPALMTFQGLHSTRAAELALLVGPVLAILVSFLLFWPPRLHPRATVLAGSIVLLTAAGLVRSPVLFGFYGGAALLLGVHLARRRSVRFASLLPYSGLLVVLAVSTAWSLPRLQPWVEGKTADLLDQSFEASAGLSLTSRLGEVESLSMSPEVALRIWTTRPQYMRARVYTRFDGKTWHAGDFGRARTLSRTANAGPELAEWLEEVPGTTYAVPGEAAEPADVRTKVLQSLMTSRVVPAPAGVRLVRLGDAVPRIDGAGVLSQAGILPGMYSLVNRRVGNVAQPADSPGKGTLDVPESLDPRLKDLAESLTDGATPEERIRRTLEHLGRTCTYSLKVGEWTRPDPIGEFVFDKKRGYCEYFASAAALLLRLEGVPSRYVVGYSVRPSNLEGGHYVVRQADAHAWIEAFVPGRGWVEFDPTPGGQFEAMRESVRGGFGSGLWERVAAWVAELLALYRQGGFVEMAKGLLGPVGSVILFAFLVWAALKLRRGKFRWPIRARKQRPNSEGKGNPVPPELSQLMARLDAHWKRNGKPRPATRAPLEHFLSLQGPARAGREAIDAYYRTVYGGVPPAPEELAGIRRKLEESAIP